MTKLEDFRPLRAAEVVLLHAYQTGEIAKVGLRRPLVPTVETTVRGEFVAFLARGGEADRIAGRRIQLVGAWIEGRIDLRNTIIHEGLWFYRCVMDATPRLDGARIGGSVSFPDCLLPGLRAESCNFAGNLALNSGCTVRNEVRLAGATIGRDLNCERARLRSSERSSSPPKRRLSADGAQIAGDAILSGGFEADGDIRLVGVRISGDLRVDNARLSASVDDDGVRGEALNLDQVRVAGTVSLDQGFSAAGVVRLKHARIDGDLDCSGASFDAFGDMGIAGYATLLLDRAKVGGSLVLTRLKRPLLGASLAGAQVGALLDDVSTWGGRLVLDGFTYARFADGAPTGAPFRLAWLKRQVPAHLKKDFRSQPWQQLIAALRRMGHHADARAVGVRREAHLRRVGRLGSGLPRGLRWMSSLGHRLFGLFAGYGYRPWRLVASMALLWLLCSAMYWAAAERGVMAPTDPLVFNDPRYAHCRPDAASTRAARNGETPTRNWTRCAELPAEFPTFRPLAYSLDLLLPLVNLRQEQQWAALSDSPARAGDGSADTWGVATHVLSWIEILFGWAATLMLLALLAGRIDRERER